MAFVLIAALGATVLWIFDLGPFQRSTTVFVERGFAFEYPIEWTSISRSKHYGLHGPALMAALGIGNFDAGCVETPSSTTCGAPAWSVPNDGVVVVYRFDS
jgi:hypothetical protein